MKAEYKRTGKPMNNGCRYHEDCFSCPFPDCVAAMNLHKKGRPVSADHEGGEVKKLPSLYRREGGGVKRDQMESASDP